MKKNKVILWITLISLIFSFIFATSGCKPKPTDTSSLTSNEKSGISSSEEPSNEPTSDESATSTENSDSSDTISVIINPGSSTDSSNTSSAAASNTSGSTSSQPKPTPAFDPYADIPSSLKGTTVKVLLWYKPTDLTYELYANFKTKTGITVKPVVTTYDAYQTKLAAMVASKDTIDVCMMYAPFYPTFITKNLLQPMDSYINENDTFWDINAMKQFMWGGKYYGVASKDGGDMGTIYFNKTLFENEGQTSPRTLWKNKNWNWDTFLDAAKAMTKKINNVQIWGFNSPKNSNWMLSTGSDFVKYQNSETAPILQNLTDPNVLKGWQFMVDLRNKYKVDNAGQSVSDFIAGKVAMYGEQSWMLASGRVVDTNPLNAMTDEWDAVPWPSPKGQKAYVPMAGKVWCVPIISKNQKAAYYFMRYMLDAKNSVGEPLDADLQAVMDALVKSDKFSDTTIGLFPINDYWTLWSDIIYSADINATLNSWVPKANSFIEQVINEIPDK